MDPIRLLRATFFSNFLRRQSDFTTAMGFAYAYDHDDQEPEDRDVSRDPSESALHRSLRRLDVVDILIRRREFHAWVKYDISSSINVWTDSSPVSGDELQGLAMDITFTDDSTLRIYLPGATLQYGHCDAVNKAAGLLHAIWMIAGPGYNEVAHVCSKITSVTTDMGVEMGTVTLPDFILAFCKYMEGVPANALSGYVDRSVRWLPAALRLAGWGHAYGNMMKATAMSVQRWPQLLRQMRALVSFFQKPNLAQAHPIHVRH